MAAKHVQLKISKNAFHPVIAGMSPVIS